MLIKNTDLAIFSKLLGLLEPVGNEAIAVRIRSEATKQIASAISAFRITVFGNEDHWSNGKIITGSAIRNCITIGRTCQT